MPEHLSYEALAVLLVLLPGFVTAEVVRTLSARPKRTEFDKVIEALCYSLVDYASFVALGGKFPLSVISESTGNQQHFSIVLQRGPLVGLILLAIGVALTVAFGMQHDFPLGLMRKFGFTQRTFHASVWSDTFHTFGGYVQVELADGRIIIGWLRFFSDTADASSMFLEDAAWLREDGESFPIDGPGVLLTKDSGIRAVLFLNPDPSSSEPLAYKEL
jgi:Family of unknown function (DUF6338)